MMAFERPTDSNLMTTLITASSDENLAQRTYDLVQGQIWSQLNGGIFIWEEEPESVLAFGVSKTIQSGEISSWSNLEFWTGKRPINWVLGALGALFVLGVLTWSPQLFWPNPIKPGPVRKKSSARLQVC